MFERLLTTDIDDLKQREMERQDADRAYNDALTALDRALQRLPEMPHPPPLPDEHQVTPLNERWNILGAAPALSSGGWRGRLAGFVWRLIEPSLQRQQAFNSALVDHVNRNLPVQRAAREAMESTLAVVRQELSALVTFQSHLIRYLQQLTPYVDTKDREVAGLMLGLHAAIGGVGDELLKRWESMVARERRFDARVSSIAASHEELRASLASVQQATHVLRRESERALAPAPIPQSPVPSPQPPVPSPQPPAPSLDSWKYVGFEDQFRGSREDIRARLAEYVPLFAGAAGVVDLGCGRGEFLDLLREAGVTARGVDLNHEMVEVCRAAGFDAEETDALGYLRTLPDASVGGLFAAQVVEHLQPDYLLRMLDEAFRVLRPGAKLVLETINPACWFAFFESYIRDITHVRPLHPDTLKYLLVASGFQRVDVRFRAPYPEHEKLQTVPATPSSDVAETFNANVEKVNRLLFTYLDYAIIGERL